MKKFFGTIVFVVLAYSSFWYYEASKGKSFIEHKMSEAHIHYDKISLSGYPCYYVVSVENPSWVEENVTVSSKGTIQITSNILGNKFWVARDGDIHVKMSDFMDLDSFTLKGKSEFFFEVKNFISINHVFSALPVEFSEANSSVIFDKLSAASIYGEDLQLEVENKYETSKMDLGSLSLGWNKNVGEKSQTHRLWFSIHDYEIKRSLSGEDRQRLEDVVAKVFSKGKSQVSFDGECTFPNGNFNFLEFPEMSWNIENIESSSSIGSGKAHSIFSIVKKDENRKEIHFEFVSDNTVLEAGFKERVNELLAAIKNQKIEDFPEAQKLRELLLSHEDQVMKAIPKLYDLSPFGMNINLKVLSKANHPNFDFFDMNINSINLTMAPYSIYSGGKFDIESTQVEGSYKLKVEHYKKMIDDLISYGNNLSMVLSKVYDEPGHKGGFEVTPKMHENLLTFLKDISDEPKKDNEDLHVTFKMNKDGSAFIGNLDINHAIEKYESIFQKPEEKKPELAPAPAKEQKV